MRPRKGREPGERQSREEDGEESPWDRAGISLAARENESLASRQTVHTKLSREQYRQLWRDYRKRRGARNNARIKHNTRACRTGGPQRAYDKTTNPRYGAERIYV